MEEWKLRETHEKHVREILIAGGEMDDKGRIRQWKGKDTIKRLLDAGHSNMDFYQCDCRKA